MEQLMLEELKEVSILSFEKTCNLHIIWYSLFKRKKILLKQFFSIVSSHKKKIASHKSDKKNLTDIELLEELKLLEQIDNLIKIISGNKESFFSQKLIIKKILTESNTLKKSVNNKISLTCKKIIDYQKKVLTNYNEFLQEQEKLLKIIKKDLLNKRKKFSTVLKSIDNFYLKIKEEEKFLELFHNESLKLRENSIKSLKINIILLKSKLKEIKKNRILFQKKDSLVHLNLKANNTLQQYLGVYLNYLFEFYTYSGFIIINPHFKINDNFNKKFSEFKDLIYIYTKTLKQKFALDKKVTHELAKIIIVNRKLQTEFTKKF